MNDEAQVRDRGNRSGTSTVDTRSPDSPDSRVYAAPFARVWDAMHSEITRRRRWRVIHSDEGLGVLTAVCRTLIPGESIHLTVWVRLDEYALTRVDVRSTSRSRFGLPGGDRRRVQSLVTCLDDRLGDGTRVRP
ncbi:MAG: hypothetical protein ACWGON_00945 [Gemmatimonadota bacterium]